MSTAHDKTGQTPAHENSDPPPHYSNINLDETGVSMSWKTAAAILGAVGIIITTVLAFAAGLATKDEQHAHDNSPDAHQITFEIDGRQITKPIAKLVLDNTQMIVEVKQMANRAETAAINVQNGFYDQRAESFASQAVAKLPESVPVEKKIAKYEEYKRRAHANLEQKLPVHSGMEDLAF